MSRFKAMTPWDLAVLSFTLLICAGILLLIYYGNYYNIIRSSYTFEYSTDLIKTSSDIVQILKHQKSGIYNLDLLGRDVSLSSGDYIDNTIDDTLQEVYKNSYDIMTDYEIGFLYSYGDPKETESCGMVTPSDFFDNGEPKFLFAWPGRREPTDAGVTTSLPGPRYLFDRCDCHTGIDFAFPRGSPIYAVYSGKIDYADWHPESMNNHETSYGLFIRIEHWIGVDDPDQAKGSPDFYTYYGHLDDISSNIREGGWVDAGQQIGSCGDTGRSLGAHLHLELRDGSKRFMNPCPFFEEKPYACNFMDEKPDYCNMEAEWVTFDVPVPGAIIRNNLPKTKAVGVFYRWV